MGLSLTSERLKFEAREKDGLGRVKAHDLLTRVRKLRHGLLAKRVDLLEKGILGKKVLATSHEDYSIRSLRCLT